MSWFADHWANLVVFGIALWAVVLNLRNRKRLAELQRKLEGE